MDMQSYYARFPDERVYLAETPKQSRCLRRGMLEVTEDSSYVWAPPFNHLWVYFELLDYRLTTPGSLPDWKLRTIAEEREHLRFNRYWYPQRYWNTTMSRFEPGQLEKIIPELTKEERAHVQKTIDDIIAISPTVERPVCIYMAGGDDCSYSKLYPTLEAAEEELALLEACQPLDSYKDVIYNDFIFTN